MCLGYIDHLQVFLIVANFQKLSNVFIEKSVLKRIHAVQTCVAQGPNASIPGSALTYSDLICLRHSLGVFNKSPGDSNVQTR